MAWIWHVILILYILFIYSNSMRPAVQSSAESGRVLRLLQKLAADTGIAVPWLTEHIVRKCAHFIEYTGLGILLRQSALCVRVNGAILEEMRTEDPADGKDRTGRMRAMAPCGPSRCRRSGRGPHCLPRQPDAVADGSGRYGAGSHGRGRRPRSRPR